MEQNFRRVASHEVKTDNGTITLCIVEICNGIVVNYYKFDGEMPLTEWLGGTIYIKCDERNMLRAYQNGELIE